MAKLHVTPEAQDDLHGIKEYISVELENPIAATNMVSKIAEAMRGLINFPDRGAPLSSITDRPNNYRFLICGSYLVFYRHEDGNVYVVRVLYGRRDYMKILFGDAPENDTDQAE
jgi:plasmid stabilization system protein ParE